jgi:hypothetical protein
MQPSKQAWYLLWAYLRPLDGAENPEDAVAENSNDRGTSKNKH